MRIFYSYPFIIRGLFCAALLNLCGGIMDELVIQFGYYTRLPEQSLAHLAAYEGISLAAGYWLALLGEDADSLTPTAARFVGAAHFLAMALLLNAAEYYIVGRGYDFQLAMSTVLFGLSAGLVNIVRRYGR